MKKAKKREEKSATVRFHFLTGEVIHNQICRDEEDAYEFIEMVYRKGFIYDSKGIQFQEAYPWHTISRIEVILSYT